MSVSFIWFAVFVLLLSTGLEASRLRRCRVLVIVMFLAMAFAALLMALR